MRKLMLNSLLGWALVGIPLGWSLTACLVAQAQQEEKPAEDDKELDAPDTSSPTNQDLRMPNLLQHSVLLIGDVGFEDGSPAPDVLVTMDCARGFQQTAYSEMTGEFSFLLVSSQVPSVHSTSAYERGRPLRESLGTCILSAQLQGFDSSRLQFAVWGTRRNVGTIVLHRRGEGVGMTVSLTTLAAPKAAFDVYSKAKRQLEKENPSYSKIEQELQKAVRAYREFAAAWYLIGTCRSRQGQHSGAIEAYQKAVDADSYYLAPYLKIAESLLSQDDPKGAEDWASRVIEKEPNLIEAHYLRAFASYYQGNLKAAQEAIARVRESPEAEKYPGTHFLSGAIHATSGELESAATEFRKFLELSPESPNAEDVRRQLTEWEERGSIHRPSN